MTINTTCAAFSLIICVTAPTRSYAQAYCALRDPAQQVYQMFPDATSYRSIVRTVGDRAREEVGRRLPFKLHHNELGRHTLYVPVQGEVPIGIVHVRSEASEWGLVEIVWAFDVDLRVIDFRFQRCRDPKRSTVESGAFLRQIKGKSLSQLRTMFSEDSGTGDSGGQLAVVVLRSALKTMVVIEVVWGRDHRKIQLLARSRKAFPSAAEVHLIENPYSPSVLDALRRHLGTDGTGIDRKTVDVVRLTDAHGSTAGFTVRADWKPAGDACVLWWSVSPGGTIIEVDAVGVCDRETRQSMNSLAGTTKDRLTECATAVELAALEVLVLCRRQTQERRR